MKNLLDTPIKYLKGIGPKRAGLFNKLDIFTLQDLFYYFPRRYEDRTQLLSICQLKENEYQTIRARVLAQGEKESWKRRGFKILKLAVGDDTGTLFCVWFNQSYLKEYFKPGTKLILYGRVERYAGRLQMNSPEFEVISEEQDRSLNTGRIVPIYSLFPGITQRGFRKVIRQALDVYLPKIPDFLPYDIRTRNNLLNLYQGLVNIHFPQSHKMQQLAYRRLAFEEFFLFQLPLALRKLRGKKQLGIAHQVEGDLVERFIGSLPFRLTLAQERVLGEIRSDMASPKVMQRLLQGDVGSGKTVLATLAAIFAIQGGYQVAFMVPTEILARQHYEKISYQLSVISYQKRIKVGLVSSGLNLNKKRKEKIYQEIKEGKINLLIGTHALLEEGVKFKELGLVIIDEQHKFGVGQRALLPPKGRRADVLIMTATPIPRTLAITLYGDLDISVINELPPGRGNIQTLLFSEGDVSAAYAIAREQVRLGHQVYVVYPVIEDSELLDLAGAEKMYAELKKKEFKEYNLGLIHGRLKQAQQDEIMSKFKNRQIDILVSTTILEVGIDIANATCMLIQNAERFGLSQLHQLRGRVGRGADNSFCILISDATTPEAKARLEAMLEYNDGFRIAEADLKIRGPGEFFGRRQSGLSELKIGNPLTQMQLLKRAREEAIRLVNIDPCLQRRQNILLREKLWQRFPGYEKLIVVG